MHVRTHPPRGSLVPRSLAPHLLEDAVLLLEVEDNGRAAVLENLLYHPGAKEALAAGDDNALCGWRTLRKPERGGNRGWGVSEETMVEIDTGSRRRGQQKGGGGKNGQGCVQGVEKEAR